MEYKLRHEGNEAQKLGGRVNRSIIEETYEIRPIEKCKARKRD